MTRSTDVAPRRPDSALMPALRAGDEAAYGVLSERYRGELHLHCYRMLGSFHDAEDALLGRPLRGVRAAANVVRERMTKLIYSMLMSLDGYTEDGQGDFGWSAPDEEVHSDINELASSVGTYLYGRRMYETMVFWETAHTLPEQPQFVLDWARQWRAAEKVVYSRTLAEPRSARTRIEREFDPDAVRRLKADAEHDIAVAGPDLAAQATRAGLVDELQLIVCPVIVGGGKRFFPDGVRLDLELAEERRFGNGVVVLRYVARNP